MKYSAGKKRIKYSANKRYSTSFSGKQNQPKRQSPATVFHKSGRENSGERERAWARTELHSSQCHIFHFYPFLIDLIKNSTNSPNISPPKTIRVCAVQFLWPFQTFSDSKGRHSPSGIDFDALENNDDPVGPFNPLDFSQNNENVTVLGEGSRDSVKFEWTITPWTECSQSCGPDFGYSVS